MDDSYLYSLSPDDFTRMKIVRGLKRAMESSRYGDVTVTAVCKLAGVQRSTFYRLFDNLDDVVYCELSRLSAISIREAPAGGDWRDSIVRQQTAYLSHLKEESEFFQRIHKEMSHTDYGAVYQSMRRYYADQLRSFITKRRPDLLNRECEFAIEFFIYGTSNSIAAWAASGMKESPRFVAENMQQCMPENLGTALQESVEAIGKDQVP